MQACATHQAQVVRVEICTAELIEFLQQTQQTFPVLTALHLVIFQSCTPNLSCCSYFLILSVPLYVLLAFRELVSFIWPS